MARQSVIEAYMRRYSRVYNPAANEAAIRQKQEQRARQEKLAKLWPTKRKD